MMDVNAIKQCPMDQEFLDHCIQRIYIECAPLTLADCDLLLRHWQAMIVNDANLRMQIARLKAQKIRVCNIVPFEKTAVKSCLFLLTCHKYVIIVNENLAQAPAGLTKRATPRRRLFFFN